MIAGFAQHTICMEHWSLGGIEKVTKHERAPKQRAYSEWLLFFFTYDPFVSSVLNPIRSHGLHILSCIRLWAESVDVVQWYNDSMIQWFARREKVVALHERRLNRALVSSQGQDKVNAPLGRAGSRSREGVSVCHVPRGFVSTAPTLGRLTRARCWPRSLRHDRATTADRSKKDCPEGR